MDELWWIVNPPAHPPPLFPGDPYFPDFQAVHDQIPIAEDVPISEKENEMEEDPEEDPEEDDQEMEPENPMEIVSDEATNVVSPNRSSVRNVRRRLKRTARMSVPNPQELDNVLGYSTSEVNTWVDQWRQTKTNNRGQTSGSATATSSEINALTQQMARLNGQMWHLSDESSTNQGEMNQMRTKMSKMEEKWEDDQLSQLNLHQRMDYFRGRVMHLDVRVSAAESQNQIALSLAHRMEESHRLLEQTVE
ncbi:unnamed protein product [Lactuca virosa]|uniref:Uncharacterized protein n=1 Tax=Lactuca virosa TaxID=75947 RepID=A0AAU9MNZ6_9ASTR|nr:unnamed protein product [Lactuca virosa]